jgi:hypothetical protein
MHGRSCVGLKDISYIIVTVNIIVKKNIISPKTKLCFAMAQYLSISLHKIIIVKIFISYVGRKSALS